MNKRKTIYWLMMLPALIFLLVFMVVPIVFIIQQSLISEAGAFSFERYAQILTSARDWKAIGLTIGVALLVTGFCELLAYPVAYLMARTKSRSWKTVFYIILVSPLLTSVVIRSFAWIVLLTQNGIINTILIAAGVTEKPLTLLWNLKAVILVYVQVLLPFAVMPLSSAFEEISTDYEKASKSLGMGRVATFFKITLPLTVTGAVSGGVMVFALTAGSYITPLLIGGGRQDFLPVRIYQQAIQLMDLQGAGAYSCVLLILVLLIILPVEYALKRWERKVYG
ncbi:ABC transporter permease [Mediterraneibacter butyricigenes]|uniref:ABC transporter permease n=1 Tax=Mediterraneibacter butyricigenes TaxID=2316025 RepID=A0A391PII5_9FIRM|nr:ABC transporter permease [Mediterraneibacter butyricigenes]GCA66382.1 ABC transporter permease [Mediterraneibacter butyricigenes]